MLPSSLPLCLTPPNMSEPTPVTPERPSGLSSRISCVSIEGFRSLKRIDSLMLPQLAVLIGANGVGKSSFIRFFEMLSWMLRARKLSEFVLHHGGGDDQFFMGARRTPRIHAEIQIETSRGTNDYRFDMTHLSAGDGIIIMNEAYRYSNRSRGTEASWRKIPSLGTEAQLPEQQDKTAQTILHLLKQCASYQFHDTSVNSNIRLRWDISDGFRLRSDGGNLAAVLLDLREQDNARYRYIVRQIRRVFPALDDFVLEPVSGKVLLRWQSHHSDKTFGAHLTSDGSLRLFCLITLLSLPEERLPAVMFLDEPELGLHPHAITLVADMIKQVAQKRQVFIATQSPYMVDCFELENIIVAEADSDGATSLRSLPRADYEAWLEDDYSLSDIWLRSPVGGHI